ncbi:LysR substrate-binding domain-containing protein [Bosea sp. BH3]|uniref:LysR substrate-binding domain-containing protein n=1 Tax=Bosea sp. BH3 TaxID=2871701 RepID=UPI0021CB3F8B|nr:LysR substrate-binding domain-containing protein [Bosea sp. BH3]MCU4182485.1 LysR family transcriptional regulator [Bosea sp. BH3]
MLNPRQVEAFRTVIVTGGVTAAARAMNITQPAVTRLIHDLQYALGLQLFARRGARLVPTNEAMSLYREVERQFVGLERIQAAAQNLREGRAGTLRVAALPAFNVGFLPRLMGGFIRERPGLDVSIYGSISSQVADWVTSGFCEVGFAQLPLEYPTLDIELLPLAAQVAVLPESHPLTARDVLGPADFAGEPFISLEQSTLLRYRIDAIFSAERITRDVRIETPLSMIACSLVSAGAGLSIVDPFTAAEYSGRGIVVKPFRPTIPSEVAVIWAAGRFRSALALDFAATVRAELETRGDLYRRGMTD